MIKALWIFGLAALVAAVVVVLAEFPGAFYVDWFGVRIETDASIAAVLLAVLLLTLYFVGRLLRWIARGPKAWRRHFAEQRTRRAMGALAHGLAAAAGGDAAEAGKAAQAAGRYATDERLAQILGLEAAQLAGRETDVQVLAEVLTKDPQTALLGWKALYDLAKARGELARATNYAQSAFEVSAGAGWAADALLADALLAKDFDRALSILDRAERGKGIVGDRASLVRATVLTALAKHDLDHNDGAKGLPSLRKAMALRTAFLPAAIERARLQMEAGRLKRAEETVLETWPRAPHPLLAEIYLKTARDDADFAARLMSLTKLSPAHVESRLVTAARYIAEGQFTAARDALKDLLLAGRTGRVCALMADLSIKESGDRARADEWMQKGLIAPRDNVWECDACGHTQAEWTAVCGRCHGVATQTWFTHKVHTAEELVPDGEEATTLVSPEDIMRIAPDAVADDDEDEVVVTSAPPKPERPAPPDKVATPPQKPMTPPQSNSDDDAVLAHQPDDPGPADKSKQREDASW